MRAASPFLILALGWAIFAAAYNDYVRAFAIAGAMGAVLVGVGVAAWRRMPDWGLTWMGLAMHASFWLTVDAVGWGTALRVSGGVGLLGLLLVVRRGWRSAGLLSFGLGGFLPMFQVVTGAVPQPGGAWVAYLMLLPGLAVAGLAWAYARWPVPALLGLVGLDLALTALCFSSGSGGGTFETAAMQQLFVIGAPLLVAELTDRTSLLSRAIRRGRPGG